MIEHPWDIVADEVSFNLEIDLKRFALEVSKDLKILEFGCGYGRICRELVSFGYTNVYGVDTSQRMILRGKREHPDLSLQHMTGNHIPYPDNHFDAVVSCAVFTCIVPKEQRAFYIKELYRVLKPSGLFHLVEFCAKRSKTFISSFNIPMWYGSPAAINFLVKEFFIRHSVVDNTNTISGRQVQSYRLFAEKRLVSPS